jgi:hypothetical protein
MYRDGDERCLLSSGDVHEAELDADLRDYVHRLDRSGRG